ncbi:hypothetical protein LJB99_00640 [Deltaproteobacteria bacterium OttesenSCG-928-K17]|nr:hypothetical protein [Deltaproteobacteria bacterium OttesenSCG-928-K17]
MKNPRTRNKTQKRRLHYLGIMAAAGLITASGGSPVMAQQTIDPVSNPTFSGGSGDTTIAGQSADSNNGQATWGSVDIDGDLIFGNVTKNGGSDPTGIDLTVGYANATVDGNITNAGSNTGANINFGGSANGLTVTGGLDGGAKGVQINNSPANTVAVQGATTGQVTLAGDGVYNLSGGVGAAGGNTTLVAGGGVGAVNIAKIIGGKGSGNITHLALNNATGVTLTDTTAPITDTVVITFDASGAQTQTVHTVGAAGSDTVLVVGGANADGKLVINDALVGGDASHQTLLNINNNATAEFGAAAKAAGITGNTAITFTTDKTDPGDYPDHNVALGNINKGATLVVGGNNSAGKVTIDKIIGADLDSKSLTSLVLNNAAGVNLDNKDITGRVEIGFSREDGVAQSLELGNVGDGSTGALLVVGGGNTGNSSLAIGNIDSTNDVWLASLGPNAINQKDGSNISGGGTVTVEVEENASVKVGDVDNSTIKTVIDDGETAGSLTTGNLTGTTVNAAVGSVSTDGDINGANITVGDGASFAQTKTDGTVSGTVAVTNSTGDQDNLKIGKLTDGTTLTVDGAVTVADVATKGTATIIGKDGNKNANQVYLEQFNTDSSVNTVLNIGDTDQAVTVNYDGTITGKYEINAHDASVFDASGSTLENGAMNVGNNGKAGTLAGGSTVTIIKDTTGSTIAGVATGTIDNVIKSDGTSTDPLNPTTTTITGAIEGGDGTANTLLTIGDTLNPTYDLVVRHDGDITQNSKTGNNAFELTIASEKNNYEQISSKEVNGNVVVNNAYGEGNAKFGVLQDDSTMIFNGNGTVAGLTAGTSATITGANTNDNRVNFGALTGDAGSLTSLNIGDGTNKVTVTGDAVTGAGLGVAINAAGNTVYTQAATTQNTGKIALSGGGAINLAMLSGVDMSVDGVRTVVGLTQGTNNSVYGADGADNSLAITNDISGGDSTANTGLTIGLNDTGATKLDVTANNIVGTNDLNEGFDLTVFEGNTFAQNAGSTVSGSVNVTNDANNDFDSIKLGQLNNAAIANITGKATVANVETGKSATIKGAGAVKVTDMTNGDDTDVTTLIIGDGLNAMNVDTDSNLHGGNAGYNLNVANGSSFVQNAAADVTGKVNILNSNTSADAAKIGWLNQDAEAKISGKATVSGVKTGEQAKVSGTAAGDEVIITDMTNGGALGTTTILDVEANVNAKTDSAINGNDGGYQINVADGGAFSQTGTSAVDGNVTVKTAGGATAALGNLVGNGVIIVESANTSVASVEKGAIKGASNNAADAKVTVTGNAGTATGGALTIGGGASELADVTVAGDLVGGAAATDKTDIIVNDGSKLNQSGGELAGYVVVDNQNTTAPEDQVKLGSLTDGTTLVVGGSVTVHDVATEKAASITGMTGDKDANQVYLEQFTTTTGTDTVLNVGDASGAVTVVYDGVITGNYDVITHDNSLFDASGSSIVNGSVTVGDNDKAGTLAGGATVIVKKDTTGSKITGVASGTQGNVIKSDGVSTTATETTITGALEGGDGINNTQLTIGDTSNPTYDLVVRHDGDITRNSATGNNAFELTIANGENYYIQDSSKKVNGNVVVNNAYGKGNAKFGVLQDDSSMIFNGNGTVAGIEAGGSSTIAGATNVAGANNVDLTSINGHATDGTTLNVGDGLGNVVAVNGGAINGSSGVTINAETGNSFGQAAGTKNTGKISIAGLGDINLELLSGAELEVDGSRAIAGLDKDTSNIVYGNGGADDSLSINDVFGGTGTGNTGLTIGKNDSGATSLDVTAGNIYAGNGSNQGFDLTVNEGSSFAQAGRVEGDVNITNNNATAGAVQLDELGNTAVVDIIGDANINKVANGESATVKGNGAGQVTIADMNNGSGGTTINVGQAGAGIEAKTNSDIDDYTVNVANGSKFTQDSNADIKNTVTVTNNNTVDQAGSALASLGKLTDGSTLIVSGAVKVADVATDGTATIHGTTNDALDSKVYLDGFTTGTGMTTLNVGADNAEVYVKYDGNITGNHTINRNANSVFDNSTGLVSGNHTIDNGTNFGALDNANITAERGSTLGTINGTLEHTNNTIVAEAGSTKSDTRVTITGDINRDHPTLTGGPASLTVGNGTSGLTVVADGSINIQENPGADFTLEVKDGSAFKQSGGNVGGTVVAKNGSGNSASDLTLGKLNNATIKTDDAIMINGTNAGSNNTITGVTADQSNGLVVMAEGGPGFGANTSLDLGNASLALTGNGNNAGNLSLNMNSTNGQSTFDAAGRIADNNGTITVADLNVASVGNNDAVIKGKDLQINNAVNVGSFGNGHLVFDASNAGSTDKGINLAGGLNINTGNGTVDFIGDNTINTTANPNNLKVAEVNINNGKFTVNGDALELGTNTGLNFDGAVGFGGTGEIFNNANVIHTGGSEDTSVKYDAGTFQNANELSVDGDTIFKSDVTIRKTGVTSGTGIYAKGAVLNANMIMQDAFTIESGYNSQSDPAITYVANASGNTPSIVLDKGSLGSSVAAGTYFEYDDSAISGNDYYQFKTVEVTQDALDDNRDAYLQNQREMWANFEYDGHAYSDGQGAKFYDKSNGTFTHISDGRAKEAMRGGPSWGHAYIGALMHYDPVLADYYGNGLFGDGKTAVAGQITPDSALGKRELIQAMGNTISATMMVTGGDSLNPSFRRLNNNTTRYDNMVAQSAGDGDLNGLWATPSFSYSEVDGDHGKGYDEFTVTNRGLTFGYDRWVEGQVRLGAFLGFNSGKLDGDWQDIDSDTVQIGAYGQAQLPEGYNMNFGVGYSWHEFEASRNVTLAHVPAANQRIKSDFDGNTITASVEVNKTFAFAPYEEVYVKPSVGYTYVGTELDSYNERSNNSTHNLAQKVKGTDFDLHLFRLGADIGTTRDDWNLVGRVYYVGNAGDTQPTTSATLRGAHSSANASARGFKVYGAKYDRHMFNPGVSLKVAPSDCSTVSIDYDLLIGSETETHNVNLSYKYEF